MAFRDFEKSLSRSRDAIRRYINEPANYRKRPPTRGNTKLSPITQRLLQREASRGRSTSSQLRVSLQLHISKPRVQQILTAPANLEYKKAKQVLPLTTRLGENRLKFASPRHTWGPAKWGTVVFSAEKNANRDGPDRVLPTIGMI